MRALIVTDIVGRLGGREFRFRAPVLLFQRDGKLVPGKGVVRLLDQRIAKRFLAGLKVTFIVARDE